MEEIVRQFREELQELIDRYKTRLSVPSIMHVAQDVFHKALSIKYHPELHTKEINGIKIPAELLEEPSHEFKKMMQGEFLRDTDYTKPVRPGSEPNAFREPNAICMQGLDGCCATYKGDWDKCKGCGMYYGGNRCID